MMGREGNVMHAGLKCLHCLDCLAPFKNENICVCNDNTCFIIEVFVLGHETYKCLELKSV